jgi:chromosome segregation ATPase
MGNTEGQNRGDPWKTKEERRDLIAKYPKLQANARGIGLDEDAVADIQLKIDKLNKQVEKEPPPGHLLESTRLFLERAKKRLAKAEEEIAELMETLATKQQQMGELQNQAQEAEGRLEQVKADLANGVENPMPDMTKVQE